MTGRAHARVVVVLAERGATKMKRYKLIRLRGGDAVQENERIQMPETASRMSVSLAGSINSQDRVMGLIL